MTPKELVALVLAERQDEFSIHQHVEDQMHTSLIYAEKFGENIRAKMIDIKKKKNRDRVAGSLKGLAQPANPRGKSVPAL